MKIFSSVFLYIYIFLIFAQNIDCGYTSEKVLTIYVLEQSKNNRYYDPCKPQFYYIKVGFKGVFIAWTCFPDVFMFLTMTLSCSTCNPQFRARIGLVSHQRTNQHTQTYSRNNDGLSH